MADHGLPERCRPPVPYGVLSQAQDGDPRALRVLYQRFGPMLYGVALRILRSEDDAQDVVQEVFAALPENLRRYEGRGSFEGWLRRVGTNEALTQLRRRRRRREVRFGGSTPGAHRPIPSREGAIIAAADLEAALARLSEGLRLVFVLREVEGYTHLEIADILGIRPGTSQVRLHRAKRHLRRSLGP